MQTSDFAVKGFEAGLGKALNRLNVRFELQVARRISLGRSMEASSISFMGRGELKGEMGRRGKELQIFLQRGQTGPTRFAKDIGFHAAAAARERMPA